MLFTEDQLRLESNPLQILDEAIYLTEKEATIHPSMVTVVENSRLQSYVIDFNGIRRLSEQHGIDYIDAIIAVAEADGIDLNQACVATDEADLIENPELASLGAVVVRPLSELDEEFQFCLEALDAYVETDDEVYLDAITEEISLDEGKVLRRIKKNIAKNKAMGKIPSSPQETPPNVQEELKRVADRIRNRRNDERESKPTVQSSGTSSSNSSSSGRSGSSNGGGSSRSVWDLIPSTKSLNSVSSGSSFGSSAAKAVSGSNSSGSGSSSSGSSSGGSSLGSKISSAFSSLTGSKSSGGSGGTSGGSASPTQPSSGSGMGFGTKAAIGAGIGAAVIGGGMLAYKQYQNRPKSVIAKRIAALRQTYAKFMNKANSAPNDGIKNKLKHVAGKILQVIDKLMAYLQKKAD